MSDFEKLVQEMREAQKAWFRYHDQLDLTRAKTLERKVDAALERKAALDQVPDLFADSNTANQHGPASAELRRGKRTRTNSDQHGSADGEEPGEDASGRDGGHE